MKAPSAPRILAGLIAGLGLGYVAGPDTVFGPALQTVGGIWLDTLRMTIIPLVFALIVTGLGARLETGQSAAVAGRAIRLFVILLLASAVFGVMLGTAMFSGWEVTGLDVVRPTAGPAAPELPALGDTLRALVPVNPFASAAQGAIVPIVIFALFFAAALRQIDGARAELLLSAFKAIADTLLVIIGWVLWAAPIGVFALAFDAAASSGLSVGAVLAWYVLARVVGSTILLVLFVTFVAFFARTPLTAFLRAASPAQSVAFSTQSSLAALPAMIEGARTLGLPDREAGTVLPLAVALFRISAPTAIAVAVLALAHLNGIALGPPQLALIVAFAALNNLVIAGLPNQISLFAAYAPVAIAVGVPIELLPLFLAVDTVPDMFATTANVTADLAVAAVLTEGEVGQASELELPT